MGWSNKIYERKSINIIRINAVNSKKETILEITIFWNL